MLKRIIACLLLCCCLSAAALAEPFVYAGVSIYRHDEAFFRQHAPDYRWLARGRTEELLSLLQSGQADGVALSSAYCDIPALKSQGLLLDLSASDAIRAAVSRMIAPLRSLLTTGDGAIIAVPTRLSVYGVYMHAEAWRKAGLTQADMPRSYEELLGFLEDWITRIAAQPEKNISVTDALYHGKYDEAFYRRWLLNILLPCWTMQAMNAGESPQCSTPGFIALVERTLDVADRLYRTEPKKRGRYALFGNYLSASPISVWSQEYGLASSLPLRITTDQPPLYRCWLECAAARRDSAWADIGLQWAESALQSANVQDFLIYEDVSAPAYRVDNRAYPVSDAWMADYRAAQSALSFSPDPFWRSMEAAEGKLRLIEALAADEITPAEFAQGLDALLAA